MRPYLLLVLLAAFFQRTSVAQSLQTSICGVYTSPGGLYERLEFNGRGKVTISGGIKTVWRDCFQYNDTLVVYPDKDVFRFHVLADGALEGISRWVQGSHWKKQVAASNCNRKDTLSADKLRQMYAFERWMLRMERRELDEAAVAKMMAALVQLCDSGYGRACNRVGTMLLFSSGSAEAREVWQKGCDAGDAAACKNLADAFKEEKNIAQARPLYEKACKLGDVEACTWDFEDQLKKSNPPAKRKSH